MNPPPLTMLVMSECLERRSDGRGQRGKSKDDWPCGLNKVVVLHCGLAPCWRTFVAIYSWVFFVPTLSDGAAFWMAFLPIIRIDFTAVPPRNRSSSFFVRVVLVKR